MKSKVDAAPAETLIELVTSNGALGFVVPIPTEPIPVIIKDEVPEPT